MVPKAENKVTSATKKYLIICVVLVVLTLIEYLIFKIDSIRSNALVMYPSLGILSLVKLYLVVGSYMHLDGEPRILKMLFFGGVGLTLLIFIILTLTSPV